MTTALAVAATVVAGLVAVLGGVSTLAGRRIGGVHVVGAGLLEAVLVVQAVVAGVRLAGGYRLPETAAFLGYLIGVVLLPVAGLLYARTERSRWAGTVLAVAAVVTAVMVWRAVQLWDAGA